MSTLLFQLLVNGVINGCLYALVAVSYALIYNTTRVFHIAHGAAYTVGAYLCFYFLIRRGWPLWAAMVAAILLCALLGALMEWLLYAPLFRRRSSLLVAFLSSLGFYTAAVNIVALAFGNETQVLRSGVAETITLGAVIVTKIQVAQALTAGMLLAALLLALHRSRWGRMIRAVRDNPVLASVMGINLFAVRTAVFAVGSSLAALAAILSALDVGMDPHIGMPALLTAAVALIIGGVGTFHGPVLGGLVLGLVQSLVVWQFSARWTDAVTFAVLILFLVFRPSGMLSRRQRLEEQAA
ncbi:MAG: branched-chain amino acid ABC transporter permease [Acidobacteriota bacterium]